jgi:hypothetical protein
MKYRITVTSTSFARSFVRSNLTKSQMLRYLMRMLKEDTFTAFNIEVTP